MPQGGRRRPPRARPYARAVFAGRMRREEVPLGRDHDRTNAVLVFALAACVLVPFAGARDLFDLDEGRYAAVALDMVRSGDWVTPRLNDMPFLDKPPLVYWIQAAATTAFGSSELVARLPTLLGGCCWVLFVFLFARAWTGSEQRAWWAALLAATSAAGFAGSRIGPQMDMPLAACVAGALYAAWCGLRRPSRRASLGLGLAIGLGLLVKGPLVAAVPFVVAVAWTVAGVAPRRALRVVLAPWAWLVALAVATPWYVLAERAHPGWIPHFLVYEHLGRFGEGDHRDFHPFWFYVPIVVLYLVPWTPLAWVGRARGWRRLLALVTGSPWGRAPWRAVLTRTFPIGRQGASVSASSLAWGWFLAAFLLYSVSTRKLLHYLLPAAAPLFVLVGARLDALLTAGRRLPALLPLLAGVAAIVASRLVAAGRLLPLATGDLPARIDAPRWAPLAPRWLEAGAGAVICALLALLVVRRPTRRGALLVAGAACLWWGLDLGLAAVDEVGSSRRLAERLAVEAAAGRTPVCLKRYPQGTRFYADVGVLVAGGTPDAWWQREIVNPYARAAWESGPGPHGGGLLTTDEFERRWRDEAGLVVVCRYKEIPYLHAHVLAGPFAGAGRTDLYLVTNRPPPEAAGPPGSR